MPSRKAAIRAANAPPLPENVVIRRYEEADRDEVCKLFWKGACVGDDSAMYIGLRNLHLQPISVVFYYLFATGIAIVYFQKPQFSLPASLSHFSFAQTSKEGEILDPTYLGGTLVFLSVLIVVLIRWRLRKSLWKACKHAWKTDLGLDLGRYYAFEKEVGVNEKALGDDKGVSGFWVAEAYEKVKSGKSEEEKKVLVGCVGLDSRTQEDKSISEIRRLAVLPLAKYRKQGIGKALLYEAVSYARRQKHASISNKKDGGLKKLVAKVSTYEPGAWQLFKKGGWKVVDADQTSTWVRKVFDYTFEYEL